MLTQPCQSVPFLSKTSIYTHFLCHYVTLFDTISVTLLYIIGVGECYLFLSTFNSAERRVLYKFVLYLPIINEYLLKIPKNFINFAF